MLGDGAVGLPAKYYAMESSSEIVAGCELLSGLTVCAAESEGEPEEPPALFLRGRLPLDAIPDTSSGAVSKAQDVRLVCKR